MKNIRLGTLNARSIKSKEEFIMENFNECKLNALLITETWPQNAVEDDTWFKQVNFAKMAKKYLTSTDKIKGVEA